MLAKGTKFLKNYACKIEKIPRKFYCSNLKNEKVDQKGVIDEDKIIDDKSSEKSSDNAKEDSQSIFFSDQELSSPRLGRTSLTRLLKCLEIDPKYSDRAIKEIYNLYEEENQYEIQTRQVETLKVVTQNNKEKIKVLNNHIVTQENEQNESLKRLSDQLIKEKTFSISKIARECLDIIDNVHRCLDTYSAQIANVDHTNKSEGESFLFEKIKECLALINSICQKHGISPMEVNQGDIADPNFHDIVFFVPIQGKSENEIVHVSQMGYMIGERILRPAKVGVIKN